MTIQPVRIPLLYPRSLDHKTIMMRMTRTAIMAPERNFCWYILLYPSASSAMSKPLGTYLKIIFLSVPDARSIDESACVSWRESVAGLDY